MNKFIEENSIKAFIPAADNKTQLKTDVIPVSALEDKVVLDKKFNANLDDIYTTALHETIGQFFPDERYTELFHENLIKAMIKECE